MARSTGLLPRLWRVFRPASRTPTPYAVACPSCGFLLQGHRQPRHQVLPCPRCKHSVFILPCSPFSTPAAAGGRLRTTPRPRFFWVMPVLAGATTLLILSAVFLAVLPSLSRQSLSPEDSAKPVREQIEAGRKTLAQGSFHQASLDLGQASEQLREQPQLLPLVEQRQLFQSYRQADLLDRLLSQSLQELLGQAQAGREEEWLARFRKDYQGKTVVFDDLLRVDAEGRPALSFTSVSSGEVSARIALEDLRLLAWFQQGQQPRRVIFGARLAGFRLEPGGHWVIRFEPESGVFLTDPDAFRACAPTLLENDVTEILNRQKEWLEQAPQ